MKEKAKAKEEEEEEGEFEADREAKCIFVIFTNISSIVRRGAPPTSLRDSIRCTAFVELKNDNDPPFS